MTIKKNIVNLNKKTKKDDIFSDGKPSEKMNAFAHQLHYKTKR